MTSKILPKLRELMTLNKFTWYVLPRSDEHQSEYLAKCDQRVAFLSGFTGSNAIAIVSQEQALLWTDGRYFLQAQKQLYEGWSMKKMIATEKKWFEHIYDSYKEGATIGIDSRLITAGSAQLRFKTLQEKGYTIIAEPRNLVDELWENRPGSSACEIFVHEEWAGKGIKEKVDWIREQIKAKNGNAALFSDLSQIAWVLNLRSGQIPYNPFFKSILVITLENGLLYLPKNHPSKNNQAVIEQLSQVNIQLGEYEPQFPQKTLVQKSSLNHYIYSNLKEPIEWEGIGLQRAIRPEKEITGFRNCHIRDAIAQVKFWAWRSKKEKVNEYQAAEYINARRLELEHNRGLSFDTISSGGGNAAMIHYSPTQTNNADITKDMIHLVDSGGQYLDGTTDVTRTFHFGKPTSQEKDSYTRVLLGNLDVERVKWPKTSKITGADVDILARRHLWQAHKDYCHGTGHGVGYFLGVHEGPVGISKYNQTVFEPNMIVTNEPGYYENDKYGIRIENILVVKEENQFYGFECLTLCPYDWNLIDESLLSVKDRDYINKYHARVRETLLPLLKDDKETAEWLTHATRVV